MSFSSSVSRSDYIGNGASSVYNYTFRIFDETDLTVIVRDTNNVETTLQLTTDYTVTGVGSSGGGTIVLVDSGQSWLDGDGDLITDYVITIRRILPLTQETDIRNQGAFYPEIHEDQFDKNVMISQQQQDDIDRSVKLPQTIAASNFDPTLPSSILDYPDYIVKINSSGDGFDIGPSANNVDLAEGYADAAQTSASNASNYAVDSSEHATTASRWAKETSGTVIDADTLVDSNEYSAKEYAVGVQRRGQPNGGSAKDWANYTGGTVDNTNYSAKYWAQYTDALLSEPVPIAKGGTNSGTTLNNNRVMQSSGGAIVESSAITASRALISDANGIPTHSSVTSTELANLSGVTGVTGSGKVVLDTSPSLTTPSIGAATATSINQTTIPTNKTLVVTTDKLSALASTTSAELAGIISDETGSGKLVFDTSPTLVTPVLGAATASSLAIGESLDASSVVDIASTTKGFLEPRMTTTQRDAIATPATGLQIYNTTTNKLNYYNGSAWKEAGGVGVWATGAIYAVNDAVIYSGYFYLCVVGHTASSTFETDRIAGKWVESNKLPYSENLAVNGFNFEDNDVGGWTATGCATVTNGLPVSVGSGAAAFSSSNGGSAKGANTSNPAIVSSGQLNGLYSLNLATTGAGTIGDGYVSSAYPIPIKYQAKVLTLEFAYKVVTGSPVMGGTSSDTYAVAVYDVANNAWLGVTNPFCFNTTSGVGIARTQFQTASNTTSLQIFVYSPVAPTGASALYLDDFSIRPQEISYGSVQLDTIAYTPTWTGLGTPAVNTAYYRKEGDCLYVSGTVTGGTHSASVVSLTLPAGLTIDSSKIATATTVGDMNATNTPFSGAMYKGSSNTLIYLVSGSATPASASPGTTWANGTQFGFNFKVPILGWSSSVQMSSDASTRVLSVYYTGSPPTGTLSAAYNDVTFATKVTDTHNIYSGATATIPTTGFYNINASLGITATASAVNASARLICAIYVNTTQIVKNDAFTVTTASSSIEATATLNGIFLTAGSTVKIQSYVDSALTSPAWSSDPARNYLNITQCQGPSQIAATERIAAIITGDPASASSGNPIIVPTVIYDSHGAYNATTGRYTCPAPGLYKMYGAMQSASSATSLTLYKNAASTILAGNLDSNGEATFAGSMYCLAGDIIDIRPGGTVDATSFALNIERS